MVDFIVDNWQIIVSGFLAFLTLLAQFAKRKVKGYTWLDYLNQSLLFIPCYCIQAENKFDNGSNKKKFVLEAVLSKFSSYVDLKSLSADELKYAENVILSHIEFVLTTPQKKEVIK